jgi:glyoxylase I family protein
MLTGMDALRVVVDDVDAALVAFEAAGYSLAERWGPPFAVLSGRGADVWLSGPGTSAARSLEGLDDADAAAASVRPVLDVADVGATVAALTSAGWSVAGELVSGPGGTQQLLRRGPVFLEVFSGG